MANRTVKDANSVKGTNPQYLIEKITRSRIYESKFWKEQCFALSAELLVDKAIELRYIGGVYGGNIKPTPFLCLVLKMLQIQPEKDIIVEFISQQDCKYVRALGAMYMRLTGTSLDCYKYLEPLYLDYRKLRRMNSTGGFELIHVDEFMDEILREDRVCDVILPRIQKRYVLEEQNDLAPKENYLEGDMDDIESSSDEEEEGEFKATETARAPTPERTTRDWDRPRRSPSPRYRRSRSRSPQRRREREDRHRERGAERDRGADRDRGMERDKGADRDRGGDRVAERGDRGAERGDRGAERGDRGADRGDRGAERGDRGLDRGDRDKNRGAERDRLGDRERRDREREREKRHRDTDKDKKDKHRSHRHEEDEKNKHHKSKKSKRDRDEKKSSRSAGGGGGGGVNVDAEIAQANKLRAELGLPPLR